MAELDELVVEHVERRLLEPARLQKALGGVMGMRKAHVKKEKERVEALRRQTGDAESKLTRLFEAIENGLAELNDPEPKGRIAGLKRIRDAARAGVERAEARDTNGAEITPEALVQFVRLAKKGLRRDGGSFREKPCPEDRAAG